MTGDRNATPQATVRSLDEVRGVWQRSLLVRPDDTRDTTGFIEDGGQLIQELARDFHTIFAAVCGEG